MTEVEAPRAQPLIAVNDVLASSAWYAKLLDLQCFGDSLETTHGNTYNRLHRAGRLVLQLHSWDDEDHPNLKDAGKAPAGHGVLLWFEVDDFDAAEKRARALGARVVLEPFVNPAPRHRELWLRDPDGYFVVIASPDCEAA
ncbi:VOC family protein [Nitratireductor sp. XY-223]|uniref:VOC family protein n=1 Tax=Nitratireductor sp. XY-223 TaxID=2561926 RepID=UPI0010AA9022|nr:VOC family protein [Nitratireductor sp. XY-223]